MFGAAGRELIDPFIKAVAKVVSEGDKRFLLGSFQLINPSPLQIAAMWTVLCSVSHALHLSSYQ